MSKEEDDQAFDKMMAEIADSDEESDDSADLAAFYSAQPKPQLSGTEAPPGSFQTGLAIKHYEDDDIQFGGASSAAVGGGGSAAEDEVAFEALRAYVVKGARSGDGFIQCYVDRDRQGLNRLAPVYRLYMEPPGGLGEGEEGRFLMAARKRPGNKTSNYLLSMDPHPTDRASRRVVGKLRANWTGSEYTMYDHGLNPEKCEAPSAVRRELGLVKFEYDEMGPGRMRCFVPATTGAGSAQVWRPTGEEGTLAAAVAAAAEGGGGGGGAAAGGEGGGGGGAADGRLMTLENKRPKWDEGHGGHVLNFGGRVTESSVKNFQMFCHDTDDDTTLQFGRVGKNRFTLDFKYPLSPLQAFSICLASLDGKLADSKGYENMKKMGTAEGKGGADSDDDEAAGSKRGTMRGSTGITGTLRDRAPTTQYLKDKLRRMSKK